MFKNKTIMQNVLYNLRILHWDKNTERTNFDIDILIELLLQNSCDSRKIIEFGKISVCVCVCGNKI